MAAISTIEEIQTKLSIENEESAQLLFDYIKKNSPVAKLKCDGQDDVRIDSDDDYRHPNDFLKDSLLVDLDVTSKNIVLEYLQKALELIK